MKHTHKESHGKFSVVVALLGNSFVTILKIITASITGSTTMFAESVHSFADTLNQSLLLIGINRSKKPADHVRGYGYGIERFFWSLISACGVLFIGAGVTVYHSITSLINHHASAPTNSLLSIIVLLIAFIVESITLYIAVKSITGEKKFSLSLFKDADPVTLAVVYEDGAAVIGVVVAMIAQYVSFVTGNYMYDAIGGILIGLILGILAIILITKNYIYIIGKPLDEKTQKKVIQFMNEDPCIEHVVDFKSVAIDIGQYRVYTTVEWNGSPLYEEIYDDGELKEEFEYIRDDFGEFTKLMFKTTDRIPRLVGKRIDEIEKKITEKFPEIVYLDIEIN
jgi:zinc transporter 9